LCEEDLCLLNLGHSLLNLDKGVIEDLVDIVSLILNGLETFILSALWLDDLEQLFVDCGIVLGITEHFLFADFTRVELNLGFLFHETNFGGHVEFSLLLWLQCLELATFCFKVLDAHLWVESSVLGQDHLALLLDLMAVLPIVPQFVEELILRLNNLLDLVHLSEHFGHRIRLYQSFIRF
jgi:hypothetical protein